MPGGQNDGKQGLTILLVDDNAAMRALIRTLVAGVATDIQECSSGEAALECYARVHPDWVLMDIKLGGIDGLTAARAIRQLDGEARILVVTEYGDEHYRRAAAAAGARGFVLKDDLLQLPELLARLGSS